MLVVMDAGARPEQIETVIRHIEKMGMKAHPIPGASRTAIGITGRAGTADPEVLEIKAARGKAIRLRGRLDRCNSSAGRRGSGRRA